MGINSDLPLDERHLAFNKMFHWRQCFPPARRISTQLLIKNPSDSRRLGLHYASADSVTADTFYNYYEFQFLPPLCKKLAASLSL